MHFFLFWGICEKHTVHLTVFSLYGVVVISLIIHLKFVVYTALLKYGIRSMPRFNFTSLFQSERLAKSLKN